MRIRSLYTRYCGPLHCWLSKRPVNWEWRSLRELERGQSVASSIQVLQCARCCIHYALYTGWLGWPLLAMLNLQLQTYLYHCVDSNATIDKNQCDMVYHLCRSFLQWLLIVIFPTLGKLAFYFYFVWHWLALWGKICQTEKNKSVAYAPWKYFVVSYQ